MKLSSPVLKDKMMVFNFTRFVISMKIISQKVFPYLWFFYVLANSTDLFQNGYELTSCVFKSVHSIGKCMCAAECVKYSDCASANYLLHNFTCQLNNARSADVSPALKIQTAGVMYGERTDFIQGLTGQCTTTSCPSYHKCIELSSQETTCLQTSCGQTPPTMVDGSQKASVNTPAPVGTVIQYTCTSGLTLDGTGTSTCGTDGAWSSPGECTGCHSSPPTMTGGSLTTSLTLPTGEGTQVHYQCDEMKSTNGPMYSRCNNKLWTAIGSCINDCTKKTGYQELGGSGGRSCYKAFSIQETFHNAQAACVNDGSRLLRLPDTSQVINILSGSTQVYWIDGTDEISEKTWKYYDGTASPLDKDSAHWCSGRPKTDPANQHDCLTLKPSCGGANIFYDETCSESFYYMCEYVFP